MNRLVCAIVRAARVTGESAVFQNNGEALWRRLRESMEDLLAGLWAEGALAGEFAARREVLESVPFVQGWGVEIALLLDISAAYGMHSVTQVDLGFPRTR